MLHETVFRTDDVVPAERFDRWCRHISRSFWPADMVSDHVSDFQAHQRILDLGAVRLCTAEYLPMTMRRTDKLIQRSDPELCLVTLLLRGRMGVTRPGCDTAYGEYDLVVQDSSRPACIQATGAGDPDRDKISDLSVLVPRALLRCPADQPVVLVSLLATPALRCAHG
jgi:AraC-binding-like domain